MGQPFGLKGFVKVKPFSGETAHFYRLNNVTLKQGKNEENREVAEVITQGAVLLVRFAGIDTPEKAKLLNGAEIIAGREYATPLNEGEYYVEDLKGLTVINPNTETLGRITEIIEGGGGNLAEVELPNGQKRFVPFRNEFFGEVNLTAGKIVLNEPWILET